MGPRPIGAAPADVCASESLPGLHLHAGLWPNALDSHNPAGVCRSLWKLCSLVVVSAIGRESDQSGSTREVRGRVFCSSEGQGGGWGAEMLVKELSGGRASALNMNVQFNASREVSVPAATAPGKELRLAHRPPGAPTCPSQSRPLPPSPGGGPHMDLSGNHSLASA